MYTKQISDAVKVVKLNAIYIPNNSVKEKK